MWVVIINMAIYNNITIRNKLHMVHLSDSPKKRYWFDSCLTYKENNNHGRPYCAILSCRDGSRASPNWQI